MGQGKFVAIEGSDGSGKGTHTNLLVEWLGSRGCNVHMVDFPRYGEPSAYFVEQYLNGDFGSLASIDAYKASLFYALDRYAASFGIRSALQKGQIVIANRYVGSNMAHQGGKIQDPQARRDYLKWLTQLEYETLGIPKPDLNIVLSMPPASSTKLIDQKGKRGYIKKGSRDIHEQDEGHLVRAYETFNELTETFPSDYLRLDCVEAGNLRSVYDIQEQIRSLVSTLLS
jgi:dTMP kinase